MLFPSGTSAELLHELLLQWPPAQFLCLHSASSSVGKVLSLCSDPPGPVRTEQEAPAARRPPERAAAAVRSRWRSPPGEV